LHNKSTDILAYRDLSKDINIARRQAAAIQYREMVKIGDIKDYDPKSLRHIDAKVTVCGHSIFLVECNTRVHELVASRLGVNIERLLNGLPSKGRRSEFQSIGNIPFEEYVNLVECGTSGVAKIPDASLTMEPPPNRRRSSPWIVLEVAFRNETYRRLLIEGSNWVNQYSDTEFCVLVWIKENGQQADVDDMELLVFRRCFPFRSDQDEIGSPECTGWENLNPLDTIKEDLESQLRVSILFRQKVSRASLAAGQRVAFNLPTDMADTYFGQRRVFRDSRIRLDLTDTFEALFRGINARVAAHTYPNG
jgi:hypothetical protein